jgi:hypothetical protein
MKYLLVFSLLLTSCATAPKGCHIEAVQSSSARTEKIVIDDPKGAPGICVIEAHDLIFDCTHNYKVKFNYEDSR